MQNDRHLALIDADRRRLVRAATRLLGPAEAEDAVQDAYVRALEADTLALDAAQAWLLTVMSNGAIDRLRRRGWMQRWLAQASLANVQPQWQRSKASSAPSAESDAALMQEAVHALRLLAAGLSPADGAAVLLHEVFEVEHAEIASASGGSEAGNRQRLRRALSRLRELAASQSRRAPKSDPRAREGSPPDLESGEDAVFRIYLRALQLRDPQALWAMLPNPPISAVMGVTSAAAARGTGAAPSTRCGIVQVGGRLGLVLTLDGVALCVLPLGVRSSDEREPALL